MEFIEYKKHNGVKQGMLNLVLKQIQDEKQNQKSENVIKMKIEQSQQVLNSIKGGKSEETPFVDKFINKTEVSPENRSPSQNKGTKNAGLAIF